MDLFNLIAVLVKLAVMFGIALGLAALLTWFERKQSAVIQDRVGPNRANLGRFTFKGLLHIVADTVKLFIKEDFIPRDADRFLHTLAPMFALFAVVSTLAVIPFVSPVAILGREVSGVIAEVNLGILVVFALSSIGIYGAIIGGWASNNKYSLLGGMRAAAQMISYEVTMGAAVIGLIMVYGTLRLDQMAAAQGDIMWGFLPKWGIVTQPLAFVLFFTAAIAESKRTPFDLPEGESEIIGYFVEYSGMKFGMFYLGEFIAIVITSALVTSLFLGGYHIPYLMDDGFRFPLGVDILVHPWAVAALRFASFLGKLVFMCLLQLQLRWTLPRMRYDQVMRLGWKVLLPLSLANIFITGLWLGIK